MNEDHVNLKEIAILNVKKQKALNLVKGSASIANSKMKFRPFLKYDEKFWVFLDFLHLNTEKVDTRWAIAGFTEGLNIEVHHTNYVLSTHTTHTMYSGYRDPKRGWMHVEALISIPKTKEMYF